MFGKRFGKKGSFALSDLIFLYCPASSLSENLDKALNPSINCEAFFQPR